jgi:hypothetical protein
MKIHRATQYEAHQLSRFLFMIEYIKENAAIPDMEDEENEASLLQISGAELLEGLSAGKDDFVSDKTNYFIQQALKQIFDEYEKSNHLLSSMNLEALLDPDNQVVDLEKSYLDFHPRFKNMGWISVEDRQPELNKEVLVVWSDGEIGFAQRINDELESQIWDINNPNLHISHWQPLPEPPKAA